MEIRRIGSHVRCNTKFVVLIKIQFCSTALRNTQVNWSYKLTLDSHACTWISSMAFRKCQQSTKHMTIIHAMQSGQSVGTLNISSAVLTGSKLIELQITQTIRIHCKCISIKLYYYVDTMIDKWSRRTRPHNLRKRPHNRYLTNLDICQNGLFISRCFLKTCTNTRRPILISILYI